MCFLITLFFIIVPILEVLLYWTLIDHYGFMPILSLTLITSFVGSIILKIHKINSHVNKDSLTQSNIQKMVADHFGLWFSGVLLLMPGFITDLFGLLLLIPWCRYLIIAVLLKNTRNSLRVSIFNGGQGASAYELFEKEIQSDYNDDDDDDDYNDNDDDNDDGDNDEGDIIDVEATPISKKESDDGTFATIENVADKKSSSSSEQEEVIDVEFKVNNK